jgi:hypothetical protein
MFAAMASCNAEPFRKAAPCGTLQADQHQSCAEHTYAAYTYRYCLLPNSILLFLSSRHALQSLHSLRAAANGCKKSSKATFSDKLNHRCAKLPAWY